MTLILGEVVKYLEALCKQGPLTLCVDKLSVTKTYSIIELHKDGLVTIATELSWLLHPHAKAYEALSQLRKLVLLKRVFKPLSNKINLAFVK